MFGNLEASGFFYLRIFFNCDYVIISCVYICSHFMFKLQVETILDKDNYTLEELLDEDEIIQECKALNGRLINL